MDYPHNFGARQRFQFQVPCVQSSCEIRSLKESKWRADDLGGRIETLHHPSRKSKGICYRSGTCQLINIKYHEMINIFEATIQWPGAIAFHLGVPVGMITTYIGSVYACKSTEIDNIPLPSFTKHEPFHTVCVKMYEVQGLLISLIQDIQRYTREWNPSSKAQRWRRCTSTNRDSDGLSLEDLRCSFDQWNVRLLDTNKKWHEHNEQVE